MGRIGFVGADGSASFVRSVGGVIFGGDFGGRLSWHEGGVGSRGVGSTVGFGRKKLLRSVESHILGN